MAEARLPLRATARSVVALTGARVRADLQYRTSFVMLTLSQAIVTLLDFAVIAVLFSQVTALGGWTLWEVALLYGMSGLAFAVADLLVGAVDYAPYLVRMGELDRLLLRPIGPLAQIVADRFALRRVGRVAQAGTVLAVAVAHVEIVWDAERILLLVVTEVSAVVIFSALFVGGTAAVLRLVDAREAVNAFTYGGQTLTQYPLTILGEWLRRIVLFGLPLAFVAYVPALRLLDKEDPSGVHANLAWLSPLVAALLALLAGTAWRAALRRYRSTGS